MLKICPCCKYVSNLYQTITFTSLLRINTYLANICICPHFSRQRKFNANLELQIYHIFAPFANISKSVFSSSENAHGDITFQQKDSLSCCSANNRQGKEQSVHFINLHVMVTKWAKNYYKQTFLRAAVSAQVLDKACKVYSGRYGHPLRTICQRSLVIERKFHCKNVWTTMLSLIHFVQFFK